MKFKLFLILCAVLLIAVSGCEKKDSRVVDSKVVDSKVVDSKVTERDVDNVVISYCKSIEAGKFDEALSYLSKHAKLELERSGKKPSLGVTADDFKMRNGLKNIKITKRQISHIAASVVFDYNFNDGTYSGDAVQLINENGKWKISETQ